MKIKCRGGSIRIQRPSIYRFTSAARSIIETAKVEAGVRRLLKTRPAGGFFGVAELAENPGRKRLGQGEGNSNES